MNEIQIFNHEEFGEIRTIEIDGQVYFVGVDVAKALDYANPIKAVLQHVDSEDRKVLTKSFCRDFLKSQNGTLENFPNRGLSIINESGLYSLILASKLQGAKKFKRWVTAEVLPTIRKTGSYNPNPPKIEDKTSVYIENLTINIGTIGEKSSGKVNIQKEKPIKKKKTNYFGKVSEHMTLSEVKKLNRLNIADELTKEQFELRAGNTYIPMFFNMLNPIERAVNFGVLMDKARELECADVIFSTAQNIMQQENCPELFELPDPELTIKKAVPLSPFPVNSLPKVLSEYLKAVSDDVQVYPEMCVLPMLSVLSVCCQGKFEIELPNTSHCEPLNLYTVTIAKPGERKSGVFNSFTAPIYEYQSKENEKRKPFISEYQANRAFLENQYHNAVKGKNASLERAKELKKELDELKPVNPLSLTANDCTAEAIAVSMSNNNGVMSIIDDECGVFDVISGLYSNGNSNIDIFLKAYDGTPVNIRRCAKQIDIKNPLITFGIMAQPKAFEIAMGNPKFIGRGLIQRFIFSFPDSKQGERTQSSPAVPENIKKAYNELIEKLLNIPTPEKLLTLRFNRSASLILKDYYDYIEVRLKTGGQLEYMSEWANKLYAKCIRIAGLLHLCEHSEAEPVDERTAQRAVSIAMWLENHAHKAFGGIEPDSDEITEKAKYILSRLKTNEYKVLSFREIVRLCRKIKKAEDFTEPLALLEDKKYIREIPVEYLGKGQRPSPKYKINSLIYDKEFNSITAQ